MPIPTPHEDEGHEEFIGRCHTALADEFEDQDTRHAICEQQWRDRNKDMSKAETKSFTPEIKETDDEKGTVLAAFAKLGVKDLDGDLTERGAFGEQKVRVSSFGHRSWGGELPVGRGRIYEKGDEALAELSFFMDTTHGRDHFRTIKGLGDLGEWSYGFDVAEEAAPDEEQRQQGIVRILKRLVVHEVSPVLRGAGVGTRTLAVKSKDGDEPKPDAEAEKATAEREAFEAEVGTYEALGFEMEVERYEALKRESEG